MTAPRPTLLRALLGAATAGLLLAALAAPARAAGPSTAQVEAAIARAQRWLIRQIGPDGACIGEYPPGDVRHGGPTALLVYALLSSGTDAASEPQLASAIAWLAAADLEGVYAVSARVLALAATREESHRAQVEADARWLVLAAAEDGSYTYTSANGGPAGDYDNSNSHFAPLAVWTAMSRGVEVPTQYWQRVQRHWQRQQQPGGGWGYRALGGSRATPTYGSMTAAGVATLYLCQDVLRREEFLRCTVPREDRFIQEGLDWLDRRFTATGNPGRGMEWTYYWLYGVHRAGWASGRRYFGGQDWYAAGAAELLRRQNTDGSWDYADRVAPTSLALLFLARGHSPVLINKLRWSGRWNPRPRDAAHLTQWISEAIERPMAWQVVDLAADDADWSTAPVLYVSGAGPIELSDEQIVKLRRFIYRGGLLLSEAACNNGDFTMDIQRLYERLLPGLEVAHLPDDHPVHRLQHRMEHPGGMLGVSNGVRMLAIHSPQEISLDLQRGYAPGREGTFRQMTNLLLYATDFGDLPARTHETWPAPDARPPQRVLAVARLVHDAGWNPEPLGWQRLAIWAHNEHGIRLDVSPVPIAELDPDRHAVAHLTGTRTLELTDEQAEALRRFFAAGGTLVVDAAGMSQEFIASVEQSLLRLAGAGSGFAPLLAPSHPLYRDGPTAIAQVTYRRATALALGADRNRPRLRAVQEADGRLAILYSPEDLTAGLVGYRRANLRGYAPQSALELMLNALHYAHTQRVARARLLPD